MYTSLFKYLQRKFLTPVKHLKTNNDTFYKTYLNFSISTAC